MLYQNTSIFLDASALMSIVIREGNANNIEETICNYTSIYINAMSFMFVYRHCLKLIRKENEDYRPNLERVIKRIKIIPVNDNVCFEATRLLQGNDDFEDAVQVASALQENVDNIITCDEAFAKRYNHLIQIISV